MRDEDTSTPPERQAPPDSEPSNVVAFPAQGSKENPFPRRDSETLSLLLTQFALDVRFNLRAQRIEWDGVGILDLDGTWQAISERKHAELRERIERQEYWVRGARGPKALRWGREAFRDTLNALLYHRERDPFEEWLDALPPWDGAARLASMLYSMFSVEWSALAEWASHYIFLGAVQRTYEPGCKLDEIPVLIGDQGIGKSALLQQAVPPELPELYGDGLRWDVRDKEQVEAVLGRLIVEVAEMGGRRKAEIEHMKALITRRDDGGTRLAYARSPEPLPRRFILCATTNAENDLPNDPSGNRRFVPVVLPQGCHVEAWMQKHRDQLWAEALAMYRDGHRANLPRDLHPLQRKIAEQHRDRDEVLEDAIDGLAFDGPLTMLAITDLIGETARNVTSHRLGRALRNAGWDQHRGKRDGKFERLWTRTQ